MLAGSVLATPATSVDWSGAYVGIHLGGAGFSDVKTTEQGSAGGVFAPGTSYNGAGHSWRYDSDGRFTRAGIAGYNFQVASTVFGFKGEFGYLSLRGSKTDPLSSASDPVSRTRVGDWYGVLAGRLGVAWDRFLPYLKMGVALTDVQASVLDACSGGTCGVRSVRARNDSTKPSWAVGGGLEYALSQNWIVKGEYLFIGLGLHDRLRVSGPGLGTVGGSTWVWSQDLSSVHTGKMV